MNTPTTGTKMTITYHGRTYTGTVSDVRIDSRGFCFLLNCPRSTRGVFCRNDGSVYHVISL